MDHVLLGAFHFQLCEQNLKITHGDCNMKMMLFMFGWLCVLKICSVDLNSVSEISVESAFCVEVHSSKTISSSCNT